MNKIVVVDLDGCLCSINTFRFWILFSYIFLFLSLRLPSFFKFTKCVLLRIYGKSDRVQMKKCVLQVTERLPHLYILLFCRFLYLFVNRNVLSEMNGYKDEVIVMCTAAPAIYVNVFAQKFNFAKVFATPTVNLVNWKENIGEEKLDTLKTYYGQDVVLNCVITDHYDDLPLLLGANRRVLVNPSAVTLKMISDKFQFEIL